MKGEMEVNLKMFFMLHGADVVVHLSRIQKEILRMNREQNIRNSDRFGHVVHTDDVIIVVQVEFMSNSFCPIKPPKLINWAPSAVDGITGPG